MLYVDSSALVKLYFEEPGSAEFRLILSQHPQTALTSVVTYAEVLAALARSEREGRISRRERIGQRRVFERHWEQFSIVELSVEVLRPAARLIDAYALRGYDTVQLCSALWVGTPQFACFDKRLRAAAEQEGLEVSP